LLDFWAGLLLPRHVLNAKDMPLHDGALPENIPAPYTKCKTSLGEGRLVVPLECAPYSSLAG
jgi:hypothetical protein